MTVNKTLNADQAREILEKVSLFDDLEPEEKDILSLFNWCFVVYQPSEHLTDEDSLDKRFFILMSGQANIYKGDPPQLLTQLKAGEIIGEISFLTNEPRTASVVATVKSSALVVDQPLLDKLPASMREKLKDQIILKMAQRLNRMNNRLTLGHL